MRLLIWAFIFLLPLHAFFITLLKCKYGVDTNFIRFWKELVILWLFILVAVTTLRRYKFSLPDIYKWNYLLWTITAFSISSIIYIWFPFFEFRVSALLWFRYDVVFLIALVVWLYLLDIQKHLRFYIRTACISTFGILVIFLPWYLFGDISALASSFWYSSEVSSYTANSCISFAQWVEWQYRFQWTFGWPIRFSVFLTIIYCLFAGYILSHTSFSQKQKYLFLWGFGSLVVPAIFFSYSKTSLLGFVFCVGVFIYLTRKYIYNKKISQKFLQNLGLITLLPIVFVSIFKAELFLHLGAIINRIDNLSKSVEMFFYNPIWYGLGIAGPASQIGNSIESAGTWQIATSTPASVHRFLPENWYVQILLEQWLVWFFLFVSIIVIIGYKLWEKVKKQKDYLGIGIFTAFLALCFMANFTHAFEEAATSYTLFLIIGIYLAVDSNKK